MLTTDGGAIGNETDVRETPTADSVAAYYQASTAAQNLTVAGGFDDITGVTKTITLSSTKNVIIFGNVRAILPAAEQDVGCEVGVVIDTVSKTDSRRKSSFELYEKATGSEVAPVDSTDTIVNVAVQFHTTLGAGSHTIKLEAQSVDDGAVGWGAQLPDGKANMIILVI